MVLTELSNATDLVSIPADVAHANGTLIRLVDLDEDSISDILREYTSFIMVRHPFERVRESPRTGINSSEIKLALNIFRYGNVMVILMEIKDFNLFTQQFRYGRYIVKTYRKDPTREDVENGDNVTFREFVKFLIEEHDTNEHWRPIDQLCHPSCLRTTPRLSWG